MNWNKLSILLSGKPLDEIETVATPQASQPDSVTCIAWLGCAECKATVERSHGRGGRDRVMWIAECPNGCQRVEMWYESGCRELWNAGQAKHPNDEAHRPR